MKCSIRRLLLLSFLAALPFSACGRGATGLPGAATREEQLADLQGSSREPVQVAYVEDSSTIATLRGRFPSALPDHDQAARAFLARHAGAFGLASDLGDLRLQRRDDDAGGATLRYRQVVGDVPVVDGVMVVGFDRAGAIIHVTNDHVAGLGAPGRPSLPGSAAAGRVEVALGAALPPGTTPELVLVAGDKDHPGHHLAWQVNAVLEDPRGDWSVFVAASSGAVVRVSNHIKRAGAACVSCNPSTDSGCGLVFHDGPVEKLESTAITDASNVDAAQVGCQLGNLTSTTALTGTWANTSLTSSRIAPPYNRLRSVDQRGADEVTVYHHLDRAKRYLNEIGYPGVMSFSIAADAHDPALGDNAHYVPSGDYVEFGEGGVDDGQDPDIIYHEYGHAIQDNQVPGYGTGVESGATGEGFGDYWAASMTDAVSHPDLGTACLAAWDATTYNPYNGSAGTGCLRRLDGTKQYPRDFVWEVHDDGEMWSAALWRLREQLGPTVADPLVIKSHTFLTPTSGFLRAADALLSADVALNGGANAVAIHDAFQLQGIPRSQTPPVVGAWPRTDGWICESAHNYANHAYKECRFTQPGAQFLRFHFSRVDTETGYDFIYISDGTYRQVQQLSGQPFGTGGGYSAAVAGDTIVARFKADYSVVRFGFIIDQVDFVEPTCLTSPDCDDGDACNGAETCQAGSCVAGTPLSCGDGNVCNGAETCQAGSCVAGTPLSCGDGNACTTDSCDQGSGCANTPVGCDDGNACTADSCNPSSGCVHIPSCGGGTVASDGFESGNYSGGTGWAGSWSASGDVSIRTNDGPHSGSRHVRLRRNTGLLRRTVNVAANPASVHLRFWAKVSSFELADSAVVRVTRNGGAAVTVRTFTSADNGLYRFYDIDLGVFTASTALQITFDANMNSTSDHLFVDDVSIERVP